MTSKEQKKLKKRKAREEQTRKNLLRRKTLAQQQRKIEKEAQLKARAEEKAENRANNAMLREIREQQALANGTASLSPKAKALAEKINVAKASYEKVKTQLTPEQQQQVLKNIAVLEELEAEYVEQSEHRSQINKELEEQGFKSMEEKMKHLAEQAQEEFGEGCIDQIEGVGGSAECTFKANA